MYVPEDAAYRTGKVLFSVETFQSMKDYLHHMFLWGDYGTCLGYMGVDGNGTAIIPINTLAISSKSDNKEIAWKYIESHFSTEWQDNNITPDWNFSILEEKMDEQLNSFSREKLVNEDGVDVPIEFCTINNERFPVYGASDEDIRALKKLIEGAEIIHTSNNIVNDIIQEEAQLYFYDEISVEEAVARICNRLFLYWEENN